MARTCYTILLLFLFIAPYNLSAQEVKVRGYFTQDSAKLGERVAYVLKAEYPSGMDILFPDSLFNYGSMEFLEKQTFQSFTRDSVTVDSAVYFLSNFSLDPVKRYHLPVFEILRYDSITHSPPDAELALRLTIDKLPDALTFEETNAYQSMQAEFNYPVLILLISVLIVALILGYYFFGERIKNEWLVYLEKKRRKRFLSRWENAQSAFFAEKSLQTADDLLGIWRSYMESLTGQPYREWTATEIAENLQKPELVSDLREIEMVIYANRITDGIKQSCDRLSLLSEEVFNHKIKNLHDHE